MSKFHKNKFYRVKEKIDRSGNIVYKVQAAESRLGALFGFWIDYQKDNNSLNEAINQIKIVDSFKLKSEKIVYRESRD